MKEDLDLVGTMHQMKQNTQGPGFHLGKRKYAGPGKAVRFHRSPRLLVRIQFRTLGEQQTQTHSPLITSNLFANFSGFVHGMAIQNHKKNLATSGYQTIQKPIDRPGIRSALFRDKPHSTLPIHQVQQNQPLPCTHLVHYRRLPFPPPDCLRMIAPGQIGFILKPNFCPQLFGFPLKGENETFLPTKKTK
jgi:hypothetical protein